jgi:hypothetical protein
MQRIPDNYNWAKPGTYPVRGHNWKVSKSLSDTTIAQTVVNGMKVRFEAAWGDRAGNLTIDQTRIAILVYDATQIAEPQKAARALVEEAFDALAAAIAVTVSQEASREARSAAKEQAAKSQADAKVAEVTRKLR